MHSQQRRKFLTQFSALLAAPLWAHSSPARIPSLPEDLDVTRDEDFWHQIKQAYSVSPTLVNLNNGGVCPQPRTVQEAVEHYNRLSNETPSYYMWRILDKGREPIRRKLAVLAGASPEEIAIDRNASEALETVIFGLSLQRGDEVILTKQDYPNMINAWKQREHRDGVVLRWLDFDLPTEDPEMVVSRFRDAITPRTKIIHLTHLINWCGQLMPARDICTMAHERGVEVVLDAAHSFAHIPFSFSDLGCDYAGTSLHKWLCAPYGTGMLYVKKERIAGLYPLFGSPDPMADDIRKFEHLGTRSFATEQGIGHAVDFHNMIGTDRKFRRLHYLKNYWMDALQDVPGISFGTSRHPDFGGAIGFFSLESVEPGKIASTLLNKHRVHTVAINWEHLHGVRVTPNVYTLTSDLDVFIDGVKRLVAEQ
ncbi:MAG: aminotransferase class V-fold PLP-dependent enzyme [Saprospiraceae bacterium]|nr:aminotransferase class V-fold PLP-dependent enzyme [Saprospiraceae bacterium]